MSVMSVRSPGWSGRLALGEPLIERRPAESPLATDPRAGRTLAGSPERLEGAEADAEVVGRLFGRHHVRLTVSHCLSRDRTCTLLHEHGNMTLLENEVPGRCANTPRPAPKGISSMHRKATSLRVLAVNGQDPEIYERFEAIGHPLTVTSVRISTGPNRPWIDQPTDHLPSAAELDAICRDCGEVPCSCDPGDEQCDLILEAEPDLGDDDEPEGWA
jgi:hypothetical protein